MSEINQIYILATLLKSQNMKNIFIYLKVNTVSIIPNIKIQLNNNFTIIYVKDINFILHNLIYNEYYCL